MTVYRAKVTVIGVAEVSRPVACEMRLQREIQMNADTMNHMLYDANKKSLLIAYLLWWLTGGFGGHRFYTGRIGSAWAMLIIMACSIPLAFVLVGIFTGGAVVIWWVVDAFLLPEMVRRKNMELISSLGRGSMPSPSLA